MPLKSIAVFVDNSPASAARTNYAIRLALRHGAHLIGIFVAPSGWHGNPAESYVRGHEAIRALIERQKAEERAASETANRTFHAATAREEISFEFRIIAQDDAGEQAKLNSLHVDLVIVGHPGPGGLPNAWSAEAMLLATGVPFLVVPDAWGEKTVGERIVVGWNASREARRAIADSLALLTDAQAVFVVVVDAAKSGRHGEEPGADVARYLSRHGANVTVAQLASGGTSIGKVILDYAAQADADLVVLGAYSHNRTFEAVFGGVTRYLFEHSSVPLLVAH